MKVNNILKTYGEDLVALPLIKLDVSLVYKNILKTLKADIAALYSEKTYIDLITCDSDIYKTASRQDMKPWGGHPSSFKHSCNQ